jgi:hypothetical protein
MNDQIKAVENLLAANAATKPRTPQLEAAKGYLTSAMTSMQDHVSELARQCEARRLEIEKKQEELTKLQGQAETSAN